ncbi:MAG: hypothetical protein ACYTKD_15155 [Planctomycetota bacterium]|jgi:hypothetical protein
MAKPKGPKALFIAACAGVVVSAGVHAASSLGMRADARALMPFLLAVLAAAMAVFVPCALTYSRMLKEKGFVDTWRALLGNMAWWARGALAASMLLPVVFALATARDLARAGVEFDLDGLMVRGLSALWFVFFAASAAFLDARERIDAAAGGDGGDDNVDKVKDEPPKP